MALTQAFVFDPVTGQTVDTRTMTCGWHGPHNALREPVLYEAFNASGTVTIGAISVATPSASPVPFKVVKRDSDGTLTDVATGTFPANALQVDAAGLNLSAATFTNALPAASYAVIPSGTLTESQLRPGFYSWTEAPADGSGFVATLQIAVA